MMRSRPRSVLTALGVSALLVAGTGIAVLDAQPASAVWFLACAALLATAGAVSFIGQRPAHAGIAAGLSLAATGIAVWHSLFVADRVFFGVSVLLVTLPCGSALVVLLRWLRAHEGRASTA